MYTSGGDLHLELPTGQQGGTKQLWVSITLFTLQCGCYCKSLLW